MVLRLLTALLLFAAPVVAHAGTRLTYGYGPSGTRVIEVADNGDAWADLDYGRKIYLKGDALFLAEARLTGLQITGLADILAVPRPRRQSFGTGPAPASPVFVERGRTVIGGREGRSFFLRGPNDQMSPEPWVVIGDDPPLTALAVRLRLLEGAMLALGRIDQRMPAEIEDRGDEMLRLLDAGVALKIGPLELRTVETIDLPSIALPEAPEPSAVARARIVRELPREPNVIQPAGISVSRAAFVDGRLWMLAYRAELSSLAAGERIRTRHQVDGPVMDICRHGDRLLAVTGASNEGVAWQVRERSGTEWRMVASIARAGDSFGGLDCSGDELAVLTSHRLIRLMARRQRVVPLQSRLGPRVGEVVLHRAASALYVGFDVGEWGGGVQRIDVRTGAVQAIERAVSGEHCMRPLHTACDPIAAIVPIPWRPDCLAVSVARFHMVARGRIVSICPGEIDVFYDPERPEVAGGWPRPRDEDRVAFTQIVAGDDALLAAGDDGVHRITAQGATFEGWPRFEEIDGVMVSFERPDVVLLINNFFREPSPAVEPIMAAR